MSTIRVKHEKERGCGYRKPGGLYFVCDGPGRACGRLPIPLTVCPCCNAGIKPSRGFQWVLGSLFGEAACQFDEVRSSMCDGCPLGSIKPETKVGLMWVGEKFYPTPADFMKEGAAMGISKRIPQIPLDFKVGESWIMLAHRKAIGPILPVPFEGEPENQEPIFEPGVFQAFRPSRIEYVIKGTETQEELDRLEKRGVTLVKVIPDTSGEQSKINFEGEDEGIEPKEAPVIPIN